MIDVKTYTEKKILQQICAAEEHLNDYLAVVRNNSGAIKKCAIALSEGTDDCSSEEAASFCLDCLAKHALTIMALADEGVRYIPENREFYAKILAATEEMFNDLPNFDREKADLYINAYRNPRKQLVAKYLITGKLACEGKKLGNKHKHLS